MQIWPLTLVLTMDGFTSVAEPMNRFVHRRDIAKMVAIGLRVHLFAP